MNIKTADRLTELRKAKGLSQEELAERLGVSRQAVSKWERAESSPDTDNLIELAKIYGVTLDKLIYGNETEAGDNSSVSEQTEETLSEHEEKAYFSEDDISVTVDDGKTYLKVKRKARIVELLYPLGALILTITYLVLGFILPNGQGWANYWFLFILIPVVGSVGDAIISKSISRFNYPCFVTAVYCAVGMIAGIWHPTWAAFVTIPVFYILTSAFGKNEKSTSENNE